MAPAEIVPSTKSDLLDLLCELPGHLRMRSLSVILPTDDSALQTFIYGRMMRCTSLTRLTYWNDKIEMGHEVFAIVEALPRLRYVNFQWSGAGVLFNHAKARLDVTGVLMDLIDWTTALPFCQFSVLNFDCYNVDSWASH